jgi:hypothetical protein
VADDHPIEQFGGRQETRAAVAQVAGNSVQIDPGGATFPSIGAALASITDNSKQKQYLLTIGPGTYGEQVTLKPYCYLQGAGRGQTIVAFPPTAEPWGRGTIIACSNSNIGDMTVSCVGGTWGNWSTALNIAGSAPFYVDDVELISDDQGNAGINSETVAVNWNASPATQSQVYLSYCTVTSNMRSNQSVAVAIIVNGPANAELMETKVVAASTGEQSFGVQSNGGAVVNLYDCYAQGSTFALNIPDYSSTLIATNCQIDGPIGQGVQVVSNPPPQ